MRTIAELYPDLVAYIDEIDEKGITANLLSKIISVHQPNSAYNKKLYDRYRCLVGSVPIFSRTPRFEEDNPINNKINNDFFSEIIDFKTGYFAGEPISYGYSKTEEAEKVTGGAEKIEIATKTITDFITRNNMYGVDMETTKFASIYGYAGRLFYIDENGNERVMPVHGFETIILFERNISEPKYAIRYYPNADINGIVEWVVEFYDNKFIHTYKGNLMSLTYSGVKEHLFDFCPLQGIANNNELLGDAEKILSLIDDYDKVLSDNSNEIESFIHSYMVFENIKVDKETATKMQQSGTINMRSMGTQEGKVYFLTKNINDSFTEHHLERLQDNIYRFSKTPNLNDDSFGSASGISLKFKLHGLETKCGMFEAKMMDAAQYMWKVLNSAWVKKKITIDPLQITMDFKRNFPLDTLTEAQTAQALISTGIPKEVAFSQLSFVDDVDYLMQLIEKEQANMPTFDMAMLETEEDTEEKEDTEQEV